MLRSPLSLLAAAALVTACTAGPLHEGSGDPVIEAHSPDDEVQTVALALRRLGAKGPYYAGSTEEFELVVQGQITSNVDWSTTGGSFEVDDRVIAWTLPSDQVKASVTVGVTSLAGDYIQRSFSFGLSGGSPPSWLVDPAAQGLVDPTVDAVGACRLAIDSSDTPHVVYRNETHQQLWYATWDGSDWDLDMIDGPGFDTGGAVSGHVAFTVSSSGVPHVAYRYNGSSEIRYATLSGLTWTREVANPTVSTDGGYGLSIALDPVNGNRATIAFSNYSATYPRPAVTYRTGPGSWVDESYTNTDYYYDYFLGGLAFDSGGTASLVYEIYDLHVLTWTAGSGFITDTDITDASFGDSSRAELQLDASQQPIVIHEEGIEHLVSSTWGHSDYEASDNTHFGLGTHNGSPRIGVRHGGSLEFLGLDSESFWTYTQIDDMDSSDRASVAVDGSGVTHACYIKNNEVWFY